MADEESLFITEKKNLPDKQHTYNNVAISRFSRRKSTNYYQLLEYQTNTDSI